MSGFNEGWREEVLMMSGKLDNGLPKNKNDANRYATGIMRSIKKQIWIFK